MEDLIGTIVVFAFFIISALVKAARRRQQQLERQAPPPPTAQQRRPRTQNEEQPRPDRTSLEDTLRSLGLDVPPGSLGPEHRRTEPQPQPHVRTQPQRRPEGPRRSLGDATRAVQSRPGREATWSRWERPPRYLAPAAPAAVEPEPEEELAGVALSSEEALARALAEELSAAPLRRPLPAVSLAGAVHDGGELFRDAVILQSVLAPNRRF